MFKPLKYDSGGNQELFEGARRLLVGLGCYNSKQVDSAIASD